MQRCQTERNDVDGKEFLSARWDGIFDLLARVQIDVSCIYSNIHQRSLKVEYLVFGASFKVIIRLMVNI